MKTIVLVLFLAGAAVAGSSNALDLSSVPCPPGGVPDPRTDEYTLDDGVGENSIGLTAGGTMIWLNQFQVYDAYSTIGEVRVAWGQVAAGQPAEIVIFDDPNNDGNAQDLDSGALLWSAGITSEGTDTDTFFSYPVPNVYVGNDGDYFYIGVCCDQYAGEYPARIDQTFSMFQSWVGGDGSQSWNCENPNTGSIGMLNIIDNYGLPGNWMVRASAIPDIPPPEYTGACCIGDQGDCTVMYPWQCEDANGQYMGDGVPCEPNPCSPTPIVPSTWGSIKGLYR